MAKYQCPDCQYIYDESKGEPHEGFQPDTRWDEIPDEWACPDCAVRDKPDFVLIEGSAGPEKVSSSEVNPEISDTATTAEITREAVTEGQKTEGKSNPGVTDSQSEAPFRKWICITCDHIYDEALGDEVEGIAPGTRFEDIPDDWCCPECGAAKDDYILYEGQDQEKTGT